ncbi:hypothetical protein ACN47E_000709 [Coniothyrium glycines]
MPELSKKDWNIQDMEVEGENESTMEYEIDAPSATSTDARELAAGDSHPFAFLDTVHEDRHADAVTEEEREGSKDEDRALQQQGTVMGARGKEKAAEMNASSTGIGLE